ncbi:MAG: hypothetical protein IH840_00475 [Candidatus Heimdallarchaeota archaeon]|nr:hypothetical protein [Candidatus Heimdallarchaeota archaeon]
MEALGSYLWMFYAAGVLLLSAASLGGGIEFRGIKIPRLTLRTRILSAMLGLTFIVFAYFGTEPTNHVIPKPTIVTFHASPEGITAGGSTSLHWSVSDARTVKIEPSIGPPIGTVEHEDERIVSPSQTTTYTLTATNDGGTVEKVKTIIVGPSPTPTIVKFLADPERVTVGGSSTLSWKVTGATTVSIEPSVGSVPLSGTRTISPSETTTYTLTATNDGVEGDAPVTVTLIVDPACERFSESYQLDCRGRGDVGCASVDILDGNVTVTSNGIGVEAHLFWVTVRGADDDIFEFNMWNYRVMGREFTYRECKYVIICTHPHSSWTDPMVFIVKSTG